MTAPKETEIKYRKRKYTLPVIFICLFFCIFLLIFPEMSLDCVKSSLRMCCESIVPSIFPFAVLCRIFTEYGGAELFSRPMSAIFEKLFKISGNGASVYILGLLSGHPQGAICAEALYKKGMLSQDEAERLCIFCSNAGPAFLIGGVGMGMLHSKKFGIILCISQLISSFICGMLMGKGHTASKSAVCASGENHPDITSCITESSFLMLKICGTVIFFEFLCMCSELLLEKVRAPHIIRSLIFGITELSFAVSYAAKRLENEALCLVLCAFFVGCSGLSVCIQTKSAAPLCFDMKKYISWKLTAGAVCAAVAYILLQF